jgi:hypothetical protein
MVLYTYLINKMWCLGILAMISENTSGCFGGGMGR